MLAATGLLLAHAPRRRARKEDVLETIRRMGVLQIDTIHVVARSPYLVLWSRLGSYDPCWLDELLAEGRLFEYWSHEASFLPIEDYGLYRHRMIDPGSMGWKYSHAWLDQHRLEVERVLAHVRARGAVMSSDFARTDGKKGGWWEWKPEKRALEMLFTAGELMIARRRNFQRVYDLRERVLPGWSDEQSLTAAAARRQLALKAVNALGLTTARWAADYFRTPKRETETLVRCLADEGALHSAQVEGWAEEPFYFHPDQTSLLESASAGKLRPTLTTLLSPFDPLVWDRVRASRMFAFDYRLECYTPAPKRLYGYFTLPVLRRGALVGRLDAKAHRKEGRFEIKALHLEPETEITDELISDLAGAFADCAAWHTTPEITITDTNPPRLASLIRRALKRL
ncbi:MAG: winged helix-turn-helix domain-containing protein [Pyrinomonadaceae bacterium]